jgi:cation transport ATPase
MDPELLAKYANHPLAQAILKDALEIQDRFAAEPVYAKTGKGFLKSAGVEEIKAAKAAAKCKEIDDKGT